MRGLHPGLWRSDIRWHMDDKYETNMTSEMTAGLVRSMGKLRGYIASTKGRTLTWYFDIFMFNAIILNMSAWYFVDNIEQFYSATRQGKVLINLACMWFYDATCNSWTCVVNHKSYFPPRTDTWRVPMCRISCMMKINSSRYKSVCQSFLEVLDN